MTLERLHDSLYTIEHDFRLFGAHLGLRTTLVKLDDGSLVVHSPGPLTPDDFAAIENVGPVSGLIGPNLMHHRYIPAAQARWPEAIVVAPRGLERKRPDLRIDVLLTPDGRGGALPGAWSTALVPFFIGGMPSLDEFAFLHPASGSLILADLAFNVRAPKPMWTRMFMQLNTGWDRLGPTRVLKSTIKDSEQARAGMQAVLAQPFDRVLVAHGAVAEAGARERLADSYAWLVNM